MAVTCEKEKAMATMNISLPEQMKAWAEECVQSGRYANVSDYVRDLIRRDHLKLEELRKALIEGENSGPSTGLDIEAFIAEQVKAGRFGSASEAIRVGLRLLEEREMRLAALRRALVEGEESGTADYSLDALNRELDAEGRG
jgi:antitoxin ParD1/3/4